MVGKLPWRGLIGSTQRIAKGNIPRMRVVFCVVVCASVFSSRMDAQQPVRLSVDRDGRISWTGEYTHKVSGCAQPG